MYHDEAPERKVSFPLCFFSSENNFNGLREVAIMEPNVLLSDELI